jgi:beta-alanine--pyruvate transaminase
MNMPENAPSSLASQLKLDAHWMPYTANRNFQRDPRLIVAAEGSWLTDDKGRKVYDSLSGLWTCGAGHTRKEIQEAVAKQLGTLDYSPGFQYGHPLSFQLAEKITDLTPGNLNHVFFTDSGSECADTAVKNGACLLAPERPGDQNQNDRPRSRLPRCEHRRYQPGRCERQP